MLREFFYGKPSDGWGDNDNSGNKLKLSRVFIVFLACIVLIGGTTVLAYLAIDFFTPNPTNFVAIGDSVTSGYGLNLDTSRPPGSHSTMLFEDLKEAGLVYEYMNLATAGHTTSDLINKLNNLTDEELEFFRNSRVVTVNIGGNNILAPFVDYLLELQLISGAGNLQSGASNVLSGAWGILYEVIAGVGGVVTDGDTSFSLSNIISSVGMAVTGIGELILGSGEIISGTIDAVNIGRGNLSEELQMLLEEGVETFAIEYVQILDWLRVNAPRATIIVNTVYNPIPQEILFISMPISTWANELITDINEIIVTESQNRGLVKADVFEIMSNRSYLMLLNLNPLQGSLSFDMIHPSLEGHRLIADLQYESFRNYFPNR